MSDFPASVEEAGALLGATITRCGVEGLEVQAPPRGMHSSFAVASPVPSAELLTRLHALRALLRSQPQHEPLVAAPSLLAVLMKLLGLSTTLATMPNLPSTTTPNSNSTSSLPSTMGHHRSAPASLSSAQSGSTGSVFSNLQLTSGSNMGLSAPTQFYRFETPPMLSTPLRKLWVDCVTLCHRLGSRLQGTAKITTTTFVRKMLDIAATNNPRSQKAAGGVRTAALDVIAALFLDGCKSDAEMKNTNTYSSSAAQLAPWSLDVLQVCLKALKSAGNGEPTYRLSALQAAKATAVASRYVYIKNHSTASTSTTSFSLTENLIMRGAYEEKASLEAIKILKLAATDKFPEVRSAAAQFAAILAPLLLNHSFQQQNVSMSSGVTGSSSSTTSSGQSDFGLDEVLVFCLKNIDDESPFCADAWAQATASCLSTAIASQEQQKNSGGGIGASGRGVGRRNPGFSALYCSSVKSVMTHLIDQFVKVGGELVAVRAGGSFSTGGRAVRVGYTLVLVHFLRLQMEFGAIGTTEGAKMTVQHAAEYILRMVGSEIDRQLAPPVKAESQSSNNMMFGSTLGNAVGGGRNNRSKGDVSLVRLAASRVLRQGLSECAMEPVQINILHNLVTMIRAQSKIAKEPTQPAMAMPLNSSQIQVVLVEISHLYTTLGEAAASTVPDFLESINFCLSHRDHGIRHEAAVACEAFTDCFPSHGRKMIQSSLKEISFSHVEMVKHCTSLELEAKSENSVEQTSVGLRSIFSRATVSKEQQIDPALPQQYEIHGKALMVSLLVRNLPRLPGGMPIDLLASVVSVAHLLVTSQFQECLTAVNPGGVCMCVRSGFAIISGVLATGSAGAATHMPCIFGTWQMCCRNASSDNLKNFHARHDLFCLDGALASIAVFLKFCSDSLLSIPEALSQVTAVLEDSLKLLLPAGRLGSIPLTPPILARLESAIASLLECFAWLPSGSFPLAADDVFSLAAQQIRASIENEVSCSILQSLVSKEDSLLDSKSWSRAIRDGQVGGARDIELTIVSLTAEAVLHGEREAVIHLLNLEDSEQINKYSRKYMKSSILGAFASDFREQPVPTPLHEVGGCWRRPFEPSSSSKVRVVDAAIQAFSASFGLKSGKEQQVAMNMLESLVPPFLTQLARTIGINTVLIEQDRRSKPKDDSVGAAVINITAVLLSCLQALPLHESTHNVPIGLGPQWMNKAKDMLLTLLPSASTVVRRAAAEGLALLATVGVTEDAHFLQSAVLHSLDEVMQGNKPDGKPKTIAFEPVSAARSGSLLTLACIQRTAYNVAQRKFSRARERAMSRDNDDVPQSDDLPILQMMTRNLSSSAYNGVYKDFFIVKTYALHSYCMLLSYSGKLDTSSVDEVDKQLLKKGIELIEGNFVASWTAASTDADRGQDAEKMASEVAFLSVLLRFMTLLVPHLHHFRSDDAEIAHRFSIMAVLILECHPQHPVVSVDAMALFEVLATHVDLLPSFSSNVLCTERPLNMAIPFILNTQLRPSPLAVFSDEGIYTTSIRSCRAAICALEALTLAGVHVSQMTDFRSVSMLVAALEVVCGYRYFFRSGLLRSLAVTRDQDVVFMEAGALENELFDVVKSFLLYESLFTEKAPDNVLRWLLMAKFILSSNASFSVSNDDDVEKYSRLGVMKNATERAASDSSLVFVASSVPRWQVKTLAAHLATCALDNLFEWSNSALSASWSSEFDMKEAGIICSNMCRKAQELGTFPPTSSIVFHLEEMITSACMSVSATVDHAELRALQGASILFLGKLVDCFKQIPDAENPQTNILEQYSLQIFSAVKHSVSEVEDCGSYEASLLFQAGCELLLKVVDAKLTKDLAALTRIIRPIIPSAMEVPFFSFDDSYPASLLIVKEDKQHENLRASLLPRISKLWVISNLFSGSDSTRCFILPIRQDLISNEVDVAVHCAAIAIDGARLLLNAHLSLSGAFIDSGNDQVCNMSKSGFLFNNAQDIDDTSKRTLVKAWSSCASYALMTLLNSLKSSSSSGIKKDACLVWIQKIVPFVISGLFHAEDLIAEMNSNLDSVPYWAIQLDPVDIKLNCIRGTICLVSLCPSADFQNSWENEIEYALNQLKESVIVPLLEDKSSVDLPILTEVCTLMTVLSSSDCVSFQSDYSLLTLLLTPLEHFQRNEFESSFPYAEKLISTCILAVSDLIEQKRMNDTLIRVMLQFVMKMNTKKKRTLSADVKKASKQLVRTCVRHKSVDDNQVRKFADFLARNDDWETWAIVLVSTRGVSAESSLGIASKRLCAENINVQLQLEALSAIQEIVQNETPPSPFVSCLVQGVGQDVLILLYRYGTMKISSDASSFRRTVIADSMKILLIAYKQVIISRSDDVTLFLSLLMETLLAIVRFNGLPNHSSTNVDGDVHIGRTMAQAFVNFARTTPGPFKSVLTELTEVDRSLLEFTVRAEMTGYQNAPAPVKKKLDLKGFTK